MKNPYEPPRDEPAHEARLAISSLSDLRYFRALLWCAPVELIGIFLLLDLRLTVLRKAGEEGHKEAAVAIAASAGLYAFVATVLFVGVAAWLARRKAYGPIRFVTINALLTLALALLVSFAFVMFDPFGTYATCETVRCNTMLALLTTAFSAGVAGAFLLPTCLAWYWLARPKKQ